MNEKIIESKKAIHVGCSDNSATPPHGLLILFIILYWFWRQKKQPMSPHCEGTAWLYKLYLKYLIRASKMAQ